MTAGGKSLLLINPHTSFFFRSEQQVTSDEGLNVYGAATWGQFFIYQGFNAHAGWMHTSSGVDNVDEFAETIERRGKRCCYRYGSECRPLAVRPVTIRYRTADGRLGVRAASPRGAPTTVRSSAQTGGRWIAFAMMDRPVQALQQSFLRTKATRSCSPTCASRSSRPTARTTQSLPTTRARSPTSIRSSSRGASDRFDYTKPVDGSDPAHRLGLAAFAPRAAELDHARPTAGSRTPTPGRTGRPARSARTDGVSQIHGHVRREFPRAPRAAAADRKPRLDARPAATAAASTPISRASPC